MFTVKINNDTFQCPSIWNELSAVQLLRIAELSRLHLNHFEFKTLMLPYLLGLQAMTIEERILEGETCFFFKEGKKNIYILAAVDISYIIQKFDFLFKISKEKSTDTAVSEPLEVYALHSRLTKSIIPYITVAGTKFYGPADGLSNILFQEYIHTETFMSKYSDTGDITFLDKIIAVLYRPQVDNYDPENIFYQGDRRELFNDFIINKRAALISKVDINLKYAIYLFYTGCINHIQKLFKEVFTATSNQEPATRNNTFLSMMKLVTALTQNDVTKNEQVRKTYLYEVMITLQEMMIQRSKMKEEIDRIKNKT